MKNTVKVIVPVAGFGTRLRPHTYSTPKPLLPVAGKPILAHVLEPVLPLHPAEVIFVVGYKGEMIEQWVRQTYDFEATFVQQDELLGLGYAVQLALNTISEGPVLVVLGDTIVQADLTSLTAAGDYVLGVMPVEDPRRFGIADIQDGRIIHLEEKPDHPRTNLAVIGLYYFKEVAPISKALADHVKSGKRTRNEIQLTDALEALIQQGHVCTPFEVSGWFDCGKRETMLSTNRFLLEQQGTFANFHDCIIIPPVHIADSADITNATVGPHVTVGDGTVIRNATVANSIVGSRARIENCELAESLIGSHATVRNARGALNIGDFCELDLR
jgi:glucose-1-phosphate thymidylyltransferase